ncbi:MAG TPA: GTPase HflX [Nitrospiria bacterium]|nr:GTPase HflX [Nitrospiria bacterium]
MQRFYRRRIPPESLLTPELARQMTELSREVGRQIGILVDRRGNVVSVMIGDHREIVIPDLSALRLGKRGLRGIRCIHTHLKNEPLSRDDLNDLALLRLDLMGAIGVGDNGLPADVHLAHLLPPNPQGKVFEVHGPKPFHQISMDFGVFVAALEEEIDRHQTRTRLSEQLQGAERAILVSVARNRSDQEESLQELAELARSANILVLGRISQRPSSIHPKYLMGQGKLKETIISALQQRAGLLIFDQTLTPLQVKAIGEVTEMKVIDRTQLILDIFARRAQTREGKVQVELAQLRYRLPRLAERSTALSRLTGGIGGRGPGETRLEVDRRRVREKISRLERELEVLAQRRGQRRERRISSRIPIMSIVGYTNAGKSTLLNALTYSRIETRDLLFSTLDTSTRRLRFPREREAIVTDTVGFIRDLPEDLFGAFRSTLDELSDASLLIHVVDVSHPQFNRQMTAVDQVLDRLQLSDKPRLLVFNKIDRLPSSTVETLCARHGAVPVSAIHPESLGVLLSAIEGRIFSRWTESTGRISEYQTSGEAI